MTRVDKTHRLVSWIGRFMILLSQAGLADDVENMEAAFRQTDIITLSNETACVKIRPAVGHIVFWGKSGEKNLLWQNSESSTDKLLKDGRWPNWGGDKVWVAPQNAWRLIHGVEKPPARAIYNGCWHVLDRGPRFVVLQSPRCLDLQVRLKRRIELDATQAVVRITNTLSREAPNPFPVFIWSLTEVHPPQFCLLDIAKDTPLPDQPFCILRDEPMGLQTIEEEQSLLLEPKAGVKAKAGTLGRWCAAVYTDTVFLTKTDGYFMNGCFPEGANITVFTRVADFPTGGSEIGSGYVELELSSPGRHLKAGETMSNHITWKIIDRLPGETPEAIAQKIRSDLTERER